MTFVSSNRRRLEPQVPPMRRIVHCQNCTRRIQHGTSQVFRKLLFHFCSKCWCAKREECNRFMQSFGPKEA